MAQYVYKKFNNAQEYGFVVSGSTTELNYSPSQFVDGYANREINKSTGAVSYARSRRLYGDDSGTIHATIGGTYFTWVFVGDGRVYRSAETVQLVNVRGSYIGQVFAENGTYPQNGRHTDGYWYERMFEATGPVLTYPNGGETFNDEDVTVTWTHGLTGFTYRVELSLNNGSTWTTLGTVSVKTFTTNFATASDSSLAKIRITPIKDGLQAIADTSDGVFTIQHNVAPLVPTNLAPSGVVVDRIKTTRLSWTHNDTDSQSKADIQWRQQGASTWIDITSNGNDREYFIGANTFSVGAIEWRVRTYDSQSVVSPWSNTAVFTAVEPSTAPTITAPTSPVAIARPVVMWTSVNQASYQVVVEDSLNATVWDSGEIVSTNKAVTIGTDLDNGGQYTIKVRIKDAGGLFSTFASTNINVSYTPPVVPILEVMTNSRGVTLLVSNPPPTGTQPTVIGNDIYKKIGDTFIRIAKDIQESYTDYETVSQATYEYQVVAIGDNETSSTSQIVTTNGPRFIGTLLHDTQDPEQSIIQLKYAAPERTQARSRDHAYQQFVGRKYPSIEYGQALSNQVSVEVHIKKEDASVLRQLERFLLSDSTIYYRDYRGRSFATTVTQLPSQDIFYGDVLTLNFVQIDYSEEV